MGLENFDRKQDKQANVIHVKDDSKRTELSSEELSRIRQKNPIDCIDNPREPIQAHDLIGHFGLFQFLMYAFKITIGLTSAFNNLGVSFFAPRSFIGHWCQDDDQSQFMSNATNAIITQTMYGRHNLGYLDIFQGFIGGADRELRHQSLNFSYRTPDYLRKECTYGTNSSTYCKAFTYDTGIWLSTIIDEWQLVCDRSWLISITQSVYMSGFLLSFPFFGHLSDRFGRWNSLLIGACIEMLAGFGCAFSGSIGTYILFRFLIGFGNAGRTSSSYLVMIEWVGPKWRMEISALGTFGWIVGYCALPWLSVYFLHFRHMQLFVCFYELVFIICLLFLPESPRWLLTKRKFRQARQVLLRAAKFNGLIINQKSKSVNDYKLSSSSEVHNANNIENNQGSTKSWLSQLRPLEPYTLEEFDRKFSDLTKTIESKEFTANEDKLTFFDLVKWKNLRKYLLILFFIWSSNSFIYYGIALQVGGENLFVSFTIAGLVELPSLIFTIILMKYLPRSKSNLIIYAITGILCLALIPIRYYKNSLLLQLCMMLAKITNSCAFDSVLYQTMELFPTSLRQTAYSSCSLAGRVGSILAPLVIEFGYKTHESAPSVLFTLLSIIGVILIRQLPETKGVDLHDTLMEAEKFKGKDLESEPKDSPVKCIKNSTDK